MVYHKEIERKVLVGDIRLADSGVVYDVWKVPTTEAQVSVDKLKAKEVISELTVDDKGNFNPVIFLLKIGGGGFHKVMDFGLLNAYFKALKTHFPLTLVTIRQILEE